MFKISTNRQSIAFDTVTMVTFLRQPQALSPTEPGPAVRLYTCPIPCQTATLHIISKHQLISFFLFLKLALTHLDRSPCTINPLHQNSISRPESRLPKTKLPRHLPHPLMWRYFSFLYLKAVPDMPIIEFSTAERAVNKSRSPSTPLFLAVGCLLP